MDIVNNEFDSSRLKQYNYFLNEIIIIFHYVLINIPSIKNVERNSKVRFVSFNKFTSTEAFGSICKDLSAHVHNKIETNRS